MTASGHCSACDVPAAVGMTLSKKYALVELGTMHADKNNVTGSTFSFHYNVGKSDPPSTQNSSKEGAKSGSTPVVLKLIQVSYPCADIIMVSGMFRLLLATKSSEPGSG